MFHITTETQTSRSSPDGSYANNNKLSRNRTQALYNYLLKTYPIDKKLFKVESTAED